MPGLFASEHLSTMCPIGLETVPFWVQPAPHLRGLSSGFGWFRITTPQRTFSYLVHSHFPNRVHRPVRLLWLFFPLSTCVYQSHAEGRGCLPFTWEAGVDWIPFHGIIDLHGYAVTKIKRPSPLIPHSQEWFRANRSHTQRPEKQLMFPHGKMRATSCQGSKNVQRSCGKIDGLPSCVGARGRQDFALRKGVDSVIEQFWSNRLSLTPPTCGLREPLDNSSCPSENIRMK